ncbi:hypothetical protein [Niveibacterium terrae]|uniref:hypothetical protein n=1 Tax=Niveibacterium terrae TaxID=3373598 RepID=UPI003A8EE87A
MSFDTESLYALLPQVLRSRDETGALKALVGILAEQARVFEEDLARLYDDHFIETCEEWVVPYIGALVGARGLAAIPERAARARNEVADTLRLRRRKGTAAVLEELASDIMDCDAAAVEFFRVLATTQNLNHLRPGNQSFTSLRDAAALESPGSAFERLAHRVEVRNIASGRGRFNIPNIGLFLWPRRAASVTRAAAFRLDERRFTFDPLGRKQSLIACPEVETEVTHLATAQNVPLPLGRRRLARELDRHYGTPALLLTVDGLDVLPARDEHADPVGSLPDLICVCDLADVRNTEGEVTGWVREAHGRIAIDPELGRIAFPVDKPAPQSVQVSYQTRRLRDLGGGEYARARLADEASTTVLRIGEGASLADALERLGGQGGVIELADNAYYVARGLDITVPAGCCLSIRAAEGRRPVLVIETGLTVRGARDSSFALDGLLIAGGHVHLANSAPGVTGQLGRARFTHCTLVPGPTPALAGVPAQIDEPRIVADIAALELILDHCICGALRVAADAVVKLTDSILDARSASAQAYSGPDGAGGALSANNATVIGRVHTREMSSASNTLFVAKPVPGGAPLRADQLHSGCVRYCFVPAGSVLPRPYRCQPGEADAIRVQPVFESLDYGDPGYCQLASCCPREIREGAEDGAEIGVFHDNYLAQRLTSLGARLDEFLRFGLAAGVRLEQD